jgi:GTP-binding protein Era
MADGDHRCGYVAIVGRPNVGKSTLLNALLGQKLSIVTPRPQTTRHRILGIDSRDDAQIIYVDTPGLHRQARKALNRAMNRAAAASLQDADAVMFVVEAARWEPEDADVLERVTAGGRPALAIVNKIDRVKPRSRLLPYVAELSARADFAAVVPVSARRGENLDRLRGLLVEHLPAGPPLFEPDRVSDRGAAFRYAEIVREKLMIRLRDELPYGLTVEIERIEDDGDLRRVAAVIWVERDSQKAIVIGQGGRQLKECGSQARRDIERIAGRKVHLELWVRVRENWADSDRELRRLGLDGE